MANSETIFHPLLPRLKEGQDRRIENFPRRGDWHARPSLELDNLSRSLKTERLEFEVNSIPDMWARPIIFEMALFDPIHPLHHRILGEWRGMLALLALRKLRRFSDLSVQSLKMPVGDEKGKGPDFLNTLSKVIPQKKYADDSSWNHLYIILFKGKPIAMTSPITLVCTSTHYSTIIHGVSWYDGKFLVDPIPYLNNVEQQALAGWLQQLKSSLLNHENINTRMPEFDRLLNLFDNFIADLGGVAGEIELSTDTLKISVGIFKYLDKPIYISGERIEQSHVRLMSSKIPTPEGSLLVVDKEIAKQWKVPEKDIFVFRAIPLDRISPGNLVGDRTTLLGTTLAGDRWCTPEEFFTDRLILIKQKNALAGTLAVKGSENLYYQDVPVTPILPLKGLVLPYLSTNDIANRLRLEQVEDDITIVFNLPLTSPDGTGKDFEISKTYHAKDDEILTLNGVPILEVWPNFTSKNWKAYYTYFSNAGDAKTFYAVPWDSSENIRPFKDRRGQIEREITSLEHFPEVLDCKIYEIDPKNNIPVQVNAGVLLIQKPEPIKPIPDEFKIGIDFGTSGTNVYSQHGHANPNRIVLFERFFKVSAPSTASRNELYFNFLPGLDEKMPFLSVFHDFLQEKEGQRPLLDGHILFLLDHKQFDATGKGVKTDLKWGEKTERIMAKAFLEQLCMQCAAESAANEAEKISWRFSFPTAFSSENEEAFISIWGQITDNNQMQTGIQPAEKDPIYKSESIAAASYFANNPGIRAPLAQGAVFIDIGGRTSDISIWQGENKMLMQTSILLAGRNIFSYPLFKKTDFLEDFFDTQEMENLKKPEVKNNQFAFYAQLDSIVNVRGGDMLNKLPSVSDETNVKEFKQLIALGLSGLFYYIGLIIKNLTASGDYERRMPNIYFGGNGSRLLHWLAAGNFKPDSAVNRLFKAVFREAYGIPGKQDFTIQVSPEPKAEVSYGLVTDDTPLNFDREKIREGFFLAGEDFEAEGKKCNWDTHLSAKEIKTGIRVPENGLNRLDSFLKVFNKEAKLAGVLPMPEDAGLIKKTWEQVNQVYANLKGTHEAEIHIEPLFIIALKELLKAKVDRWAAN